MPASAKSNPAATAARRRRARRRHGRHACRRAAPSAPWACGDDAVHQRRPRRRRLPPSPTATVGAGIGGVRGLVRLGDSLHRVGGGIDGGTGANAAIATASSLRAGCTLGDAASGCGFAGGCWRLESCGLACCSCRCFCFGFCCCCCCCAGLFAVLALGRTLLRLLLLLRAALIALAAVVAPVALSPCALRRFRAAAIVALLLAIALVALTPRSLRSRASPARGGRAPAPPEHRLQPADETGGAGPRTPAREADAGVAACTGSGRLAQRGRCAT